MSTDDKVDIIDQINYKYSTSWINKLENESHWQLYWQQQKLMEDIVKTGEKILEIGVGSGFTANYLRSKGIHVTTLDIDKDKKPNIVGNIVSMNWENFKFDHILAFEVFEHIPFIEFDKLLGRLSNVVQKSLFISLPDNKRTILNVNAKFIKLGNFEFTWRIKKNKITQEHHFWEVNYKNITQKKMREKFYAHNYKVDIEIIKSTHIFYKLDVLHS